MYKKLFENKKYYLAINKFPKTARKVDKAYQTGYHYHNGFDMENYFFILGTFRVIFGIKKDVGSCPG